MNLFSDLEMNQPTDKYRIYALLDEAAEAEERGDLEAAFALYKEAAGLGSAKAMRFIGTLYVYKKFRMTQKSNLMGLIEQGSPITPWNLHTEPEPDLKTGFEWYLKAAEAGDPPAACMAGVMYCEGLGCTKDKAQGLVWLRRALEFGADDARRFLSIYSDPVHETMPDEEYERLLAEFVSAVEGEREERFALYERLKGGSDAQLARLGYVLFTAMNLKKSQYCLFRSDSAVSGLPLVPAVTRRGMWESLVRIDLNALPSKDTLIAVSSDIDAFGTVRELYHLRRVGRAELVSPSFGWLKEKKRALVLKPDGDCASAEVLEKLASRFHLPQEETSGNVALFAENGEKEYSVEVAAITDGRVDVMLRYTVGGPDEIEQYADPQLLSLELDEEI